MERVVEVKFSNQFQVYIYYASIHVSCQLAFLYIFRFLINEMAYVIEAG